jgi:energy-converting hydrogenase Eha subunit B
MEGEMTAASDRPDFIADPLGNIQDVRPMKYSQGTASPERWVPEATAPDAGGYPPARSMASQDSASGAILAVLGLVFLVGGVVLFIGNRSGAWPTFPYAGFITSSVGLAMIAAALKMYSKL